MNKFENCPLCGKQVKPTNIRKIARQNQLYGFRMALDGIAATWGALIQNLRCDADLTDEQVQKIILMGDNDEKRQLFETCNLQGKMTVNPIVDWSDDDVWDYTHSEHLPINPLYCEGQKRVGCIGCPMAGRGGRQREFMRWPAYEKMYISAFERMLDVRKAKGLPCDWQTGMDVFRWWMEDDNVSGQLSMDDLTEDNNGTVEP